MENTRKRKIRLKDLINATLHDPSILSRLIEKNDDTFTFHTPLGNGYVFANPTDIKHIFSHKPDYVRHPTIIHITQNLLGKYGLLTLEDFSLWKKDRDTINPLFRKEKMREYADIMIKRFAQHYSEWANCIASNTPLNVSDHFTEMTLTNLLNTVFGGVSINTKILPEISRKLFYLTSPPVYPYVKLFGKIPMPLYFKYNMAKRKLIDIGNDIVKQSFTSQVAEDNLIKVLAQNHGYQTYDQLNDEMKDHLNSEALTFLLAGHDTTASTLVNVCMYFSLYPLIADKVYSEVKSVLDSRDPTYDDLSKFPYTRAVLQETLRLWPPGTYFIRTPQDEDTVGGYKVKNGDIVIIPTYAIQRHGKYWPNPEGFDPTRFLQPLTDAQQTLFMPFGQGPQSCIGGQLAMMQAIIAIVMLAQRYRLTLTPGISLKRDEGMINRLNPGVTMNVSRV